MTHPGFSVITPTAGDQAKLLQLWDSLVVQEDTAWEWIVTSNTSAPAKWPADPRARWIQADGMTVNGLRNLGAQCSRFSHLFFADDDVALPTKNHLSKRWAAHAEAPTTVLGGGYHSPEVGASFWDRAYNTLCNLWLKRFQLSSEGDLLLGGNFSCSKLVWRQHSLLEGAPWGGEETLSFLKWKASGTLMTWQRNLYVWHTPQKRALSFFQTAWRQGTGRSNARSRCEGSVLLKLLPAAGMWAPLMGLYWLIVGVASFIAAHSSHRSDAAPSPGNPSGTYPAKSTLR